MENVKNELIGLEKKFWQAIKDRDVDTAVGLTDMPCIVAGAQGVAKVDHYAFIKMVKSASYTLNHFEIKDGAQVRLVSDDVAVIAYDVHEELTVDGKPITIDASDTSTWVKRSGRWMCALHSESLTGDPYGRDRRSDL